MAFGWWKKREPEVASTISPELAQAFKALWQQSITLQTMLGRACTHYLQGRLLSTELSRPGDPARGKGVIHTIRSAGAYPFATDPIRLRLVTDIFFNVEGFRADRLVTVIIEPVMAKGEVRFKATVRKGSNKDAPSFPENTFLEKDVSALSAKIAGYLTKSPFVAPVSEMEALLEASWKWLLHQKDALKALTIAEFDAHFRGQRLGKEIAVGAKVRHIIRDTFVQDVVEDEENHLVLLAIGFKVEDYILEDAIIMTVHPIPAPKGKATYEVKVMPGRNPYAMRFPPIVFTKENIKVIPQWAASLLFHSPFIVLREAA